MKPDELQDHIFGTYVSLRIGIAVIAIIFPLLLWIVGLIKGIPLQDSMSAYYHAVSGSHSMRDWFVGILFTMGVILYLYRGFSLWEHHILNIAGVLALCVAIFPMSWNCGDDCPKFTIHGTCAILFFLCITIVCVKCSSDTLHLLHNEALEKRYKYYYRILATGMILSPLIALLFTVILRELKSYTFFVEAIGVWIFAAYWLLKSHEFSKTKAERVYLLKKS